MTEVTFDQSSRLDDRIERVLIKPKVRLTLHVPASELQYADLDPIPPEAHSDVRPIEPDVTMCDASDNVVEHDVTIEEPDVTVDESDVTIAEPDVTFEDPNIITDETQSGAGNVGQESQLPLADDPIEKLQDADKSKDSSNNRDKSDNDLRTDGAMNNDKSHPNDKHSNDPSGKSNSSSLAEDRPSNDAVLGNPTADNPDAGTPHPWVTFDDKPTDRHDPAKLKDASERQRNSEPGSFLPPSEQDKYPVLFDPLAFPEGQKQNAPNKNPQLDTTSNDPSLGRQDGSKSPDDSRGKTNGVSDSEGTGKDPHKHGDRAELHDTSSPAAVVVVQPRESGGSGTWDEPAPAEPERMDDLRGIGMDRSRTSSQTSIADTDALLPKHGQWSTGLCQCDNSCGEVCYSASCLPCATYQLASGMGQTDAHGPLCCLQCYLGDLRTRLRNRFGIRGHEDNDCCVSYWCSSCAIAQMNRELRIRRNQ